MQAYVALHHQIHQTLDHPVLIEPKNLRVLVIDSKGPDRTKVIELLRDCQYQVTGVKTGKEAFGLLAPHSSGATEVPFDLILKEHEPPHANACRLLRKLGKFDHLRQVPVVVISTQDDRDLVARCLSYGATDYLVKPLRHNELRNIWTRIWWSRRIAGSMQSLPLSHVVARGLHYPDSLSQEGSSSAEEETKCDDEEEPTSKEGSAPGNGAGNGSNGNGSNGSKEGNGTSRVEAKAFTNNGHGSNNGNGNGSSDNKNGNGSSDNKNGNGNSATKNGHNGSNGNGASTTLVPERPGSGALQGTAEGALKLKGGDGVHQENELPPKGAARSAFEQYKLSSRKRPSCELAQAEKNDGETESAAVAPELQRSKSSAHRERLQVRSSAGASTPSNRDSEDTIHPNARQTPLLPHSSLTSRDFPGSTANMQSAAQAAANAAQFAALQNASFARNVPNFNVPGWGAPPNPHVLAQAHAQAQAQAAQNHALANSGFPGLGPFNPYGLPPHMLQQLPPHPLLYPPGGAPGNPPGAPPPGMFDLAQQQLMAEAVNAANMAQNGANAQLDAQLHHQRMLAIYNSMMYGLPPHAQQQQAQSQQHPHPQHTQQPQLVGSAVGQNWRPPFAHAPFMPPHMPTQQHAPQQLTPAPQSIPETSLASGGGKGTNGASGSNRNRPSGSATEAPRRTARAAAIEKYRKKRKNLKFSKTIRYESRKALAQQRPRVKGQFVKQANGEGADASTGGGNSKRPYWQEDYEQYDEEDLDEEDENEDEMEEKEKDEDLDMDVVNSLCELKEGPAGSRGGVSKGQNGADGADSVDRRGTAHTQPVTPKAASSQGGPSHGSRGTHHHVAQHRGNMYLQRANSHHSADVCGTAHHDAGRMALLQRQSPPPHEPPHNQNAGNKHGRNGNGGSDSGSNSPDENGGNGKAEHGQHHTHTHGHATAHGHGRS